MSGAATRERWGIVAVLGAMALAVLDAGIVNVALPTLGRVFGAAPADTILVVSAYQLALLIGLLPCAHLAEHLGYRRLFAAGIGTFTMASLICAAAPSLPALVVMRFAQGLGAAAIMALGIALLRAALGTDRLPAAIGWNALTVALCSAAGPSLGALILSFGSWRWLFLAGIPVSVTALVASRALPEVKAMPGSIDAPGIALHGATAALFFVAVKVSNARPLAALALIACALLCLAVLVRRERPRAKPIVPFDLLASRLFRSAVVASICCFTAQAAGIVALPFYLQSGLGYGPPVTGLILTCWPLAVAATSLTANRLSGWLPAGGQGVAGAALLASGLLLAAALGPRAGIAPLAVAVLICGIGFGLFQFANNRNLFLTAPAERSAAAGGMQGTARLMGQTAGTLLAALIFAAIASRVSAPRIGLATGAAFALAAALVSAWKPGAAGPTAGHRGLTTTGGNARSGLAILHQAKPAER